MRVPVTGFLAPCSHQRRVECPKREVALLPLSLCSSAVSFPGGESPTTTLRPDRLSGPPPPTVQPQRLSGDTWLVNSRGHVMAEKQSALADDTQGIN